MDPFSGEGELLTITTLFHTQSHNQVVAYDPSRLSAQNRTAAKTLQQRSRIALGQAKPVLAELSTSKSTSTDPASRALMILARYTLELQQQQQQQQSAAPGESSAVESARELADREGEDAVVQVVCGIVLARAGLFDQAKALLEKHQGNLEAVALLTQIHLMQNRTDLALKEVQAAKRWAQDSLLINLAEAWVGLRVGGDSYQSCYYVYEELTPPSSETLTAQAVADMHLNRLPEAEASLTQALDMKSANTVARANQIGLACLMGKKWAEVEELVEGLRGAASSGVGGVGDGGDGGVGLLADLQETERRFDEGVDRFGPKVATAAG